MESANLGLPYIMPAQAQKHVTHNEAVRLLDALVQLAVLARDRTEPPVSPMDGERHIVAAGASDAWQGRDGTVAARQDGAWTFLQPAEGWRAWIEAEDRLVVFARGAWRTMASNPTEVQNLELFGLGTAADEINRFAAKLNTALWTARPVAEGGSGDLRYVLNKDAPDNVLSLLLSSGYSGRAEIGLVGDDAFTLKVSADGTSWRTALSFDAQSGEIEAPGPVRLRRGLTLEPLESGAAPLADGTLWQEEGGGRILVRSSGRVLPVGGDGAALVRAEPGRWIRAAVGSTTTTTTVASPAGRVSLYPYAARSDLSVSRVGLNVTVAAGGAFARIGVYASDPSGRPSELLTESAGFACSSTGPAEVPLALALKAGQQVWLAVRSSDTITLSAWQAYSSPDLDTAGVSPAVNKTLQRFVPFDQPLPGGWAYVASEAASGLAPAVWLRAA